MMPMTTINPIEWQSVGSWPDNYQTMSREEKNRLFQDMQKVFEHNKNVTIAGSWEVNLVCEEMRLVIKDMQEQIAILKAARKAGVSPKHYTRPRQIGLLMRIYLYIKTMLVNGMNPLFIWNGIDSLGSTIGSVLYNGAYRFKVLAYPRTASAQP
jgi:hypothetical protein